MLSLLAWEAAAALGRVSCSGVCGEGVPACTDVTALVKGCNNSAHLVCFTPGPLPSPVRHVHLVEGLLGQQGLHQRPGHGCVVCVAQCFCRDRAGAEIELQGSRVAALASRSLLLSTTSRRPQVSFSLPSSFQGSESVTCPADFWRKTFHPFWLHLQS